MEMLAFIYLQQSEFEQSVELFERVDAILTDQGINQKAEKFNFNFAMAAQGNRETDLATQHLSTALKINRNLLPRFVIHVSKLQQQNALSDGLKTLRNVSLIVDEPEVHFYIGVLSKYSRLYDAAISAFSFTETMARGHERENDILTAYFYYSYASTCEANNQINEAERLFRAALEIDPNHASSLNHLAYMYAEQANQLDAAFRYIQTALKVEPDNGAYLDTRGWIYYKQGDTTNAIADLTLAHERFPEDATILEHLGDAYHKHGDLDQALENWERAANISPESPSLNKKLAAPAYD